MEIKRLYAHFLITTGNYNNERIGFWVELAEGKSAEEVVSRLRERAINIVGPTAEDYYRKTKEYAREYAALESKLIKLRKEWEATAAFLKALGLNPEAPSMPQFSNLLSAVTVHSELVEDDDDDDDGDYYA